jgi:hypothetical protein
MNNNLYFNQISELLLSNFEFVEDVKKIRKKFFRKINHKSQGYISYDYNFSVLKDKKMLSDFRITMDTFMIKYKLTPRWRSYITNRVLMFPIDSAKGKLKVPEDTPISLPDGSPGIIKTFTYKGELPSRLLLVGDEKEMDVKIKAFDNSIMDFNFNKIKERKRSIKKFNTYIRWYRNYQKYLSNNKSEKNIYLTILYSDIDNKKDKEWPTQYHQFFKRSRDNTGTFGHAFFNESIKLEKTGQLLIRRAINLLDGIVYKRVK